MLYIIMLLDILSRLTLQITISICHHMKKNIIKKIQKIWGECVFEISPQLKINICYVI